MALWFRVNINFYCTLKNDIALGASASCNTIFLSAIKIDIALTKVPYLYNIFILCSEFLTLAFKNDKNITGITLYDKENKLCQYADDTSIFLEASAKNIDNSLKVLKWFHYKSGLKVNISKTKVIRIGNIRETDRRFGRENNLDWVYEFTALGINYDMKHIESITELNINPKIEKMEHTLKSWGFRNITPIGRINILKSLVLSQITHILQALPSPPKHLLTKLETLCINFIWNGKRHQVKKETLYRNTEEGGLNMLNLTEFDFSLKITWLRKLLTPDPDWKEFPINYKIDRLLFTDSKYHTTILSGIKNKFWKSVTIAFIDWYNKYKENTKTPIEFLPIWGNPNMNIPFYTQMYNSNIMFVQDLFSSNGELLDIKQLEIRIDSKIPFTVYFGIRSAIPHEWREYMSNHSRTQNLTKPTIVEWITKDKKGGKNLRKIWNHKNKTVKHIGQTKWEIELLTPDNINWKALFTMGEKCKTNIRSKYFQYQVLHRTIMTNRKLLQFNLRDNANCDFCGEIESITHLLYKCEHVKQVWESLFVWLRRIIRDEIYSDETSILVGNDKNTILVNYIFITLKHEIYKFKWRCVKYKLIFLKRTLKNCMNIELYNGNITGRERTVLGKWSPILNELRYVF